jgi:hypothetical protein
MYFWSNTKEEKKVLCIGALALLGTRLKNAILSEEQLSY